MEHQVLTEHQEAWTEYPRASIEYQEASPEYHEALIDGVPRNFDRITRSFDRIPDFFFCLLVLVGENIIKFGSFGITVEYFWDSYGTLVGSLWLHG